MLPLETIIDNAPGGLAGWLGFDPSGVSLAGLVAISIISIIRGWIVPGATVDRIVRAKDAEIERQRQTIVTLEARGDIQDETVRQLLARESATQHLIQEIHLNLMKRTGSPIPADYPPAPLPEQTGGGA